MLWKLQSLTITHLLLQVSDYKVTITHFVVVLIIGRATLRCAEIRKIVQACKCSIWESLCRKIRASFAFILCIFFFQCDNIAVAFWTAIVMYILWCLLNSWNNLCFSNSEVFKSNTNIKKLWASNSDPNYKYLSTYKGRKRNLREKIYLLPSIHALLFGSDFIWAVWKWALSEKFWQLLVCFR